MRRALTAGLGLAALVATGSIGCSSDQTSDSTGGGAEDAACSIGAPTGGGPGSASIDGSTAGICEPSTLAPGELRWPAPNAPGSGLPNQQQYDTSTPGVVIDKVTGLTWQQPISTSQYTQAQALSYCSGMGGGWRLPTRIELVSIVDITRNGPSIDPVAFPDTPASSYFWTSSAVAGSPGHAWYVPFNYGNANGWDMKTVQQPTYWVRCVR